MIKKIDTGKTRIVKIFKNEYYCDECGALLNKENPKVDYYSVGVGRKLGCKNKKECNPFFKS